MLRSEFQRAFDLAKSEADFTLVDTTSLFGYGLPDFQPVVATIEAVAATLRWQALQLNGHWDEEALNECWKLFRYRVTLLG